MRFLRYALGKFGDFLPSAIGDELLGKGRIVPFGASLGRVCIEPVDEVRL